MRCSPDSPSFAPITTEEGPVHEQRHRNCATPAHHGHIKTRHHRHGGVAHLHAGRLLCCALAGSPATAETGGTAFGGEGLGRKRTHQPAAVQRRAGWHHHCREKRIACTPGQQTAGGFRNQQPAALGLDVQGNPYRKTGDQRRSRRRRKSEPGTAIGSNKQGTRSEEGIRRRDAAITRATFRDCRRRIQVYRPHPAAGGKIKR